MLQPHIMNNMTDNEIIRYVDRNHVEVNELCRRIETLLDTITALKERCRELRNNSRAAPTDDDDDDHPVIRPIFPVQAA